MVTKEDKERFLTLNTHPTRTHYRPLPGDGTFHRGDFFENWYRDVDLGKETSKIYNVEGFLLQQIPSMLRNPSLTGVELPNTYVGDVEDPGKGRVRVCPDPHKIICKSIFLIH